VMLTAAVTRIALQMTDWHSVSASTNTSRESVCLCLSVHVSVCMTASCEFVFLIKLVQITDLFLLIIF